MKCEIIKDLLPSYIDNLTSSESNLEIEKHIENCSECKKILDEMKAEVNTENIELNKEKIKPFKKLNKRVFKAVIITLAACIAIVCSYLYFFGFGWKVNSEDMNIEYSYKDGSLLFEFELTNGKVLNSWTNAHALKNHTITFTECFPSKLDDRGKYPNQFSYGIHYMNEEGKTMEFDEDDCIVLHFKDKTEIIYLKEIVEEL